MSNQFNHAFVSSDERSFYTEVAKHYVGEGRIVDAGCFAGGTTTAFAEGLEACYPFEPILALDRFLVADQYIAAHFAQAGIDLRMGESFLPVFLRNISAFQNLIEVRAGDIFSIARVDEPIEVISIDIAKSPSINAFLMLQWFGNLIPGTSVVIHQDFHAPSQPWLAASMGELIDYFSIMRSKVGESACFRLDRQIPKQALQAAARSEWRSRRGIQSIERIAEVMGAADCKSLDIMRAQAHRSLGEGEVAKSIVEALVELNPAPEDQKWKQWLGMAVATMHPKLASSHRILAQIYDEDARFRLGDW